MGNSHLRAARLLIALVCIAAPLAAATSASAFTQPQQLHSKNGVLRATFTAAPGAAKIDGRLVHGAYTYNGQYVGPTLNVHPGDRIELTVKNDLAEETNIHFHGLHVSPAGIADNVLRRFLPGKTYKVSVKVPHDHANGLYWYHPHLHGQVNNQVFRGMAGMISVSGGEKRVRSLGRYRQRQLGLTVAQFNMSGDALIDPNDQNDATATTLVNRRSDQRADVRSGKTELWRIANMSNEIFMKLRLDGHYMWVVGEDGNPTRRPIKRRTIVIPPGSRSEVLVRAGAPGTYKLRQLPFSDGFNNFPAQELMTLRVGSAGGAPASPPLPRKLASFEDLSRAKVGTKRTWRLSFSPDSAPTFYAMINGKQFNPERVDTVARLNEVEEWTFLNETTQAHPIHLHTNDFQVVALNGKRRKPEAPIDNYMVPPSGSVTIRFKPLTYTGTAVFHCHILFHEDVGMMATIKFVKDRPSTSVVRASSFPSVHDEAVTTERVLDPGSIAPIMPSPHQHRSHDRASVASSGRRNDVGFRDVNAWIYCDLRE